MIEQKVQRLTAENLLTELDRLTDLSCEQKAKQCGYVAIAANGTEYVDVIEFMAAILEARGIPVGPSITSLDNTHPIAQACTQVQVDGSIEVDASYIQQLGLEAGDEIRVHWDGRYLCLQPIAMLSGQQV